MFPLSLKKIRALPRREIEPFSFAREITFSGWMRTIFCRRTKSQSRWTVAQDVRTNEYSYLRPGVLHVPAPKAQFFPTPLWCDLSPVEWLLRKMGQNLHMQTATWLVSRELTQAAGPWDTRLSLDDDGEYFCRVVLASNAIRFVADAKVFYRQPGFDRLSSIDRSDKKLESQFLSMQLHVDYLRSLEESERVRAASVTYLQTWLVWFVRQRPDIVKQLEQVAAKLGGQLRTRELHWKYPGFELFGMDRGKRSFLPGVKWLVIRFWDKTMFRLEDRNFAIRAGNCSRKST